MLRIHLCRQRKMASKPNTRKLLRDCTLRSTDGRQGYFNWDPAHLATRSSQHYSSSTSLTYLSGAVLHERQEHVQYTALSYTWGAEVFPRTIKINDVDFPVTENLYAFFQRARLLENTMYLWIDALCINQLDLEEKSYQVSRSGHQR